MQQKNQYRRAMFHKVFRLTCMDSLNAALSRGLGVSDKSLRLCDEQLADGRGQSIRKLLTPMDLAELGQSFFTAKQPNFLAG